MTKYLLDSSVWIEYFKASERAVPIKDIIEQETIAVSILAIAEIADKFRREGKRFDQELLFLQARSGILPLSLTVALTAAELKNNLRKENKFSLADGIHLATAQEEGLLFVTFDRDFAGVEGYAGEINSLNRQINSRCQLQRSRAIPMNISSYNFIFS